MNPETNPSYMADIALVGLILLLTYAAHFLLTKIQLFFARRAVLKNPNAENTHKVYRLLCRFGVPINNHPKDWGAYRDMFYRVNGSSQVPTELKEQLKKRLVKKGLYINNMRIIDNYQQPLSKK